MVHCEHRNLRSANLGQSHDMTSPELKMVFPTIATRMKQPDDSARQRVDSGEVGTFMLITERASQREVFERIICPMLLCDHVFNVKPKTE